MALARQCAYALVCVSAAAALVYPPMTKYPLYDPGLGGRQGDTGQYVSMYQGTPLSQIIKPFRFRVLTPYLARVVPLPPAGLLRYFDMTPDKVIEYRFAMANMAGLAVAGMLLIALCESFGFSAAWSLLGALLFFTSFTVVNFGGAPMVDAWAWAFLLMGLVAAVRGSLGALALACLAGMFAKETTLLLVPAVLLLAERPREKLWKLAALVPGLVAYAVFRHAVAPGGYEIPGNPATALENNLWRMAHGPYLWWIAFEAATAFGALIPLALIGVFALRAEPRSPLARLAWLAPAVFAVPFLIDSRFGRIWFYAFPVVIPLALKGLGSLLERGGRRVVARGAP
jgi:preprotein translocase subunit Sec61beta